MEEKEIEVITNTNDLSNFDRFEMFLKSQGLPTDNIVADVAQRKKIIQQMPDFLKGLPQETKNNANYLSKFIAGAAVGLFDASLNYLWNEVVQNLRDKVEHYGLDMFFDEAIGEKNRSNYKTKDDLVGLKDNTLLNTCKKLELISDIVYKKLSHILDMRNNIGASHPNSYYINAFELLGWLETCIKDVLEDRPSKACITVKGIVDNLKNKDDVISDDMFESFKLSITELSSKMCGNLLTSLFGLFVSNNISKVTSENIIKLAPIVWNLTNDDVKYGLGEKVSGYKSILDSIRFERAELFFDKCDGKKYYTLSDKIINISKLCDDLSDAHNGWDNFYYEPSIAREIMQYIQNDTDIPGERSDKIIKVFIICRLGKIVSSGTGVSENAKEYYDKFFSLLNKEQVKVFLKILEGDEVRCLLYGNRVHNCVEMIDNLKSSLLGDRLNEILQYITDNSDNLQNIFISKGYKDLTQSILV